MQRVLKNQIRLMEHERIFSLGLINNHAKQGIVFTIFLYISTTKYRQQLILLGNKISMNSAHLKVLMSIMNYKAEKMYANYYKCSVKCDVLMFQIHNI